MYRISALPAIALLACGMADAMHKPLMADTLSNPLINGALLQGQSASSCLNTLAYSQCGNFVSPWNDRIREALDANLDLIQGENDRIDAQANEINSLKNTTSGLTTSGLSVNGKNVISADPNGVVSIGENSIKTAEVDGVQHFYAEDANGKAIPIDITNGSDLLINGKSVQGQIDENRENINNLGQGIAASTALTSALSALPTAATDAPFSCGVGTGGYSNRFAMGIGCAAKINKRLSINAGGSHVFGGAANYGGGSLDTIAARAGFVFKLGKIESPFANNEQVQSKVKKLEELNAVLDAKYSSIQEENAAINQANKALMERLERLEAIALGLQPAANTASLK